MHAYMQLIIYYCKRLGNERTLFKQAVKQAWNNL